MVILHSLRAGGISGLTLVVFANDFIIPGMNPNERPGKRARHSTAQSPPAGKARRARQSTAQPLPPGKRARQSTAQSPPAGKARRARQSTAQPTPTGYFKRPSVATPALIRAHPLPPGRGSKMTR